MFNLPAPRARADSHGHDPCLLASRQGDVHPGAVGEQDRNALAPGQFQRVGKEVRDSIRGCVVAAPTQGRTGTPIGIALGPVCRQLGNVLGKGYAAGIGMTIGSVFGRIAGREAANNARN